MLPQDATNDWVLDLFREFQHQKLVMNVIVRLAAAGKSLEVLIGRPSIPEAQGRLPLNSRRCGPYFLLRLLQAARKASSTDDFHITTTQVRKCIDDFEKEIRNNRQSFEVAALNVTFDDVPRRIWIPARSRNSGVRVVVNASRAYLSRPSEDYQEVVEDEPTPNTPKPRPEC